MVEFIESLLPIWKIQFTNDQDQPDDSPFMINTSGMDIRIHVRTKYKTSSIAKTIKDFVTNPNMKISGHLFYTLLNICMTTPPNRRWKSRIDVHSLRRKETSLVNMHQYSMKEFCTDMYLQPRKIKNISGTLITIWSFPGKDQVLGPAERYFDVPLALASIRLPGDRTWNGTKAGLGHGKWLYLTHEGPKIGSMKKMRTYHMSTAEKFYPGLFLDKPKILWKPGQKSTTETSSSATSSEPQPQAQDQKQDQEEDQEQDQEEEIPDIPLPIPIYALTRVHTSRN